MKNIQIIKRENLCFTLPGKKVEISFVQYKREDFETLEEVTKVIYDDEIAKFCGKYEYYMSGSYYLPQEDYGHTNISMDELLDDAIAFTLGDDSQKLNWYHN